MPRIGQGLKLITVKILSWMYFYYGTIYGISRRYFGIREFSRPLLPFVTEYKTAIRKLARGSDMDNLYSDIKKKLYTDEAEVVAETFVAYANSVVATQRAYSLLPALGHPEWIDYSASVARNSERQTKLFLELRTLVYGERAIQTYLEHWTDYEHWTWTA